MYYAGIILKPSPYQVHGKIVSHQTGPWLPKRLGTVAKGLIKFNKGHILKQ